MARSVLQVGVSGPDVVTVQNCLGLTVDGDYGSQTAAAVVKFQEEMELEADGVVGQQTWAALEAEFDLPPYPPPLLSKLDNETMAQIAAIAEASDAASVSWSDRGTAPIGYTKGMAFAFATVLRKLQLGYGSALIMGQADTDNPNYDALSWYQDEFRAAGMDNSVSGVDTMRHLFVLLHGLGLRESSGEHCCGRDQSADNTDSDTCEAGAWQQSWNSHSCSTEIQTLLDEYDRRSNPQQCGLSLFEQGVSCSQADWSCYGSGIGYEFQTLAKRCPVFAAEAAGVCLRNLRQHFGPINRKEAQIKNEVDTMYQDVQAVIGQPQPQPPQPQPEPDATVDIAITTTGNVSVTVNGSKIIVGEPSRDAPPEPVHRHDAGAQRRAHRFRDYVPE